MIVLDYYIWTNRQVFYRLLCIDQPSDVYIILLYIDQQSDDSIRLLYMDQPLDVYIRLLYILYRPTIRSILDYYE